MCIYSHKLRATEISVTAHNMGCSSDCCFYIPSVTLHEQSCVCVCVCTHPSLDTSLAAPHQLEAGQLPYSIGRDRSRRNDRAKCARKFPSAYEVAHSSTHAPRSAEKNMKVASTHAPTHAPRGAQKKMERSIEAAHWGGRVPLAAHNGAGRVTEWNAPLCSSHLPDLFGRPCSQVTIASAVPPDNTILPSRRTRWRRRVLKPASQSICYRTCNTPGCALSVRSSEDNEENGSLSRTSNNVVTRSTCALQGVPSLSTRRGGREKLRKGVATQDHGQRARREWPWDTSGSMAAGRAARPNQKPAH